MDFTASKCSHSICSNDQLVEHRMSQQLQQALLPPQNKKVVPALPPNAILSLPSSLANRSLPLNKNTSCFITSITEPAASPRRPLGTTSLHPLQGPSILFTNKPVVILQEEDATLLSRVLGHNGYYRKPSSSCHSLNKDGGVHFERQLQPSLEFRPDNSLPEITEIVDDATKPAPETTDLEETVATKPHEDVSDDGPVTKPLHESPSQANHCISIQQSSSCPVESLAKEPSSSQTISKVNLEPIELYSTQRDTLYFCEDRQKEILKQDDSDSELDLSEPQQDLGLEEDEQNITSPSQLGELPLSSNTGLEDQQHTPQLAEPGARGDQTRLEELSTQHVDPGLQQSDDDTVLAVPRDKESSKRTQEDIESVAKAYNEQGSPASTQEPPSKRQRLSNDVQDTVAIKNELQTVEPPVQSLPAPLHSPITEESMVHPALEHSSQLSGVNYHDRLVSLANPHEPTDTADDGSSTADQMLPTESARQHALIPRPVHCHTHRRPDSNNDRDDSNTDNLSLSRGYGECTVLDTVVQVPSLHPEEMSHASVTGLTVRALQDSLCSESGPIQAEEVPQQLSLYSSGGGDCQIVPGDSLESSFIAEPLYSDCEVTKNKYQSTPRVKIDFGNISTLDGMTAVEEEKQSSPNVSLDGIRDSVKRSCEATLPCHSFGWRTGNSGMAQPHSSETYPITRLNLTKPSLRLGLSRKQRCKPLHNRRRK